MNKKKKEKKKEGCRGPNGGVTSHFQPWVATQQVVSRQGRRACAHGLAAVRNNNAQ